MNPIGVHDRLAGMMPDQRPEGVSVMVCVPEGVQTDDGDLTTVARVLARSQYPTTVLTGGVLYIGRDNLGPGKHEVVLEVR